MKDIIATTVIAFILGLLQSPIRDYLNGFMHALGSKVTGDDMFVYILMAIIIANRKWLRFEQKEGE